MQMHIAYKIKAADGSSLKNDSYNTLHRLGDDALSGAGAATVK